MAEEIVQEPVESYESVYLWDKINDCESRIKELEAMVMKCDITSAVDTVTFGSLPLEERILIVLQEAGEFLTPQTIAHRVGFAKPHNQARRVNPQLYELLREGKIEQRKDPNGTKPMYNFVIPMK